MSWSIDDCVDRIRRVCVYIVYCSIGWCLCTDGDGLIRLFFFLKFVVRFVFCPCYSVLGVRLVLTSVGALTLSHPLGALLVSGVSVVRFVCE